MRVYKDEILVEKNQHELQEVLDQVKTSIDLTIKEKELNVKKIEKYLRTEEATIHALKDIKESQADYSDIG
jgi:5'(3')-deoxyribonucleotidase